MPARAIAIGPFGSTPLGPRWLRRRPPERRSPRAGQHRLRVRRHARPPVPRVGPHEPAVGVRRSKLAGEREPVRSRPSSGRPGSAARTATTWSRRSSASSRNRTHCRSSTTSADCPTFTADLAPMVSTAGGRPAIRCAPRDQSGRGVAGTSSSARSSPRPATTPTWSTRSRPPTSTRPRPAPRPANSVLDNAALPRRPDFPTARANLPRPAAPSSSDTSSPLIPRQSTAVDPRSPDHARCRRAGSFVQCVADPCGIARRAGPAPHSTARPTGS